MAGWDQQGSPNTNKFYRAEEVSPEQWSQLQARMNAPEVRADIEAIQVASHKRRLMEGQRRGRITPTMKADQQDFADVYRRHGIQIPNGYNVSPQTGEIQFANETPFLQQALRTAPVTVPMIGAHVAPLFAGAQAAGVGGAGGASGASTASLPFLNPAGAAIPAAWGGPTLAGTAAQAAGAVGLGRRALDFASSDAASALGKVGAWGADWYGDRRAEGVLADDKVAADARYQAALDLIAKQRTEDLKLDADRETALQGRWQAQQDQRQTMWDAQETRLEPYRQAGQQSLARVANVQPPTRTPYRSRFMG